MTNFRYRLNAKWKRFVTIFAVVAVIIFALDLGTVIGFSLVHPAVPQKVDAVIVLGAKVGTPALKYRTLTGLAYYQEGKTNTLVLSGGQGSNEPESEAQAMSEVVKQQITKTHGTMPHLILETKSTDTFQNLGNSHALIPRAKSVVVVSDGYHLARSVAIAKHVGFRTIYWNSPKPSYYKDLDLAHYYIREAIAIIVYSPTLI